MTFRVVCPCLVRAAHQCLQRIGRDASLFKMPRPASSSLFPAIMRAVGWLTGDGLGVPWVLVLFAVPAAAYGIDIQVKQMLQLSGNSGGFSSYAMRSGWS
jgi:hypothetical protein